ncbi:hypothetical protein C8R47DRAFT_1162518 [Mycena vitilis]|nr:hypothetical protein C8R47DRAFT_1162518 [Mycena vitilis]
MLTALPPRAVTLAPTATSGIPASNVISTTHSARPPPTHSLHSEKCVFACILLLPFTASCLLSRSPLTGLLIDFFCVLRQHKAPVGLIVGVAIAILLFIASLFLVRFLFIRRARKRAAFAGPGKTLGSAAAVTPYPRPSIAKESGGAYAGHDDKPRSTPSERAAVELGAYPPPQPAPASHERTGSAGSWATPFAGAGAGGRAEPGANSSPAARQAYLAAELRAAQGVLERAGTRNPENIDLKATKARIRALEERQTSAWALGLE